MDKYWTLRSAELRETTSATWGYVGLQSLSNVPISHARFYAEYFDAEGRFCFSLAFSLASNEEGAQPPIRPGELRILRSMAGSLSPAVQPKDVRLYMLEQTSLTGERIVGENAPPMRVPPIVSGGMSEGMSWLDLSGALAPPPDSTRDLAFALVRVGSSGRPERVEILQAMSDKLREWLDEYISPHGKFIPAGRGEVPVDQDILILMRAIASRAAFENTDFLPHLSPWVTAYLAGIHDNEVPPISIVLFAPALTRVERPGSKQWLEVPPLQPGLFHVVAEGTGWCPGLFDYKVGPLPGQLVREWRK